MMILKTRTRKRKKAMAGKESTKGIVTERLPDGKFRIDIGKGEGKDIIGFLSGKMRINNINVIVGDSVLVELDPYGGHATNRIIRRFLPYEKEA